MYEKQYYVYIMASDSGTLYIGMTNDLLRRVLEHRSGNFGGFTKKYKCYKLVYYESGGDVVGALEREKQLKRWSRSKKEFLIKQMNSTWRDLSQDLF